LSEKIKLARVAVSAMAFLSLAAPAFCAIGTPVPVVNTGSNLLLKKAYGQISLGLYGPAADSLTKAVQQDRNNLSARRYLVYALLEGGKIKEALAELKVLIQDGKPEAIDYYLLGEAHLDIGWIDASELDFNKALLLNPNLTAASIGLIKIHIANSDFEGALKLCSDCLEKAKLSHNVKLVEYFTKLYASIKGAQINSQNSILFPQGEPSPEIPRPS
jgi:tetratricopeptide (TPR) repeat protein